MDNDVLMRSHPGQRPHSSRAVSSRIRYLFVWTFAFSLLITLPLWSNKVYYGDDFLRLYTGDGSIWTSNGRPLATALQYILILGTDINDISPVPLLLGLACLSYGAAFFTVRLHSGLPRLQTVLLSLGVFCNPFLAQPVLYTWDSLSILGAFSLSLAAAAYAAKNPIKNALVTILLLSGMLMLYQTAINLFLTGVIIVCCCHILRCRAFWNFMWVKAGAVVCAVLIYRFIIAPDTIADSYSLEQSKMVSSWAMFIANTPGVLSDYFALVHVAFPRGAMLLIGLPAALTLCCTIYLAGRILRQSTLPYRVNVALFCLVSPVCILLLIPGVSIFLSLPVIAPRAMPAFSGCVIFSMMIIFAVLPRRWHRLPEVGYLILLGWTSVTQVAIFNTMIKEQNYLSSVMWMIKADVARTGSVENITFIRTLRQSPDTFNTRQTFPLTDQVSPAVSPYTYPFFFLSRNTGLPVIRLPPQVLDYVPKNYISKSCDYRLFMYGTTAVVDFNTRCQTLQDR